MSNAIGDATGSYGDAWKFFTSKPIPVLSDFTKVALLGMLLQLSAAILFLGTAMLTGYDMVSDDMPLPFLVASFVIVIMMVMIGAALNAVPYSLVDERMKGREGAVLRKTAELILPMARYVVMIIAALLVLLVITFVLSALLVSVDPLAGIAPLLVGTLTGLLLIFALQFAIPEIVLNGTGILEGFGRSWGMVMKRPLIVLAFDIMFIGLLLVFGGLLGVLTLPMGAISSVPGVGGIAGIVYSTITGVINSIAITMLAVLSFYFFWKRLTGAPEKQETPHKRAKPAAKRKSRRKKR